MASADRHVFNALIDQGAAPSTLPQKEVWDLLRAWRTAFVPEVLAATGRPVHLGFEWHAYSYEFSRALEGDLAFAAYQARAVTDYVVLSAWSGASFGFRCAGPLPDFRGKRWDVIVTPLDLVWSMVFTHEDRFGPYFAEKFDLG